MQFHQTNENAGDVNNRFGEMAILAPGVKLFEISKADWQPYFGNGARQMPRPDVKRYGMVSFAQHLGKPLSQSLWEDLIHRFCISGLCIFRPGDMQQTIGHGPGHCDIWLDEKDCVKDVLVSPHFPR